jgi:c-di-GMP-binding flagellar brake protein YcgR
MYYCHAKGAKGVLKNDRLELERRKYRRIEKKHFMARFRLKQYEALDPSSTNWDTVVLKDISAGGMLCNYNKNLELDSLLDLKIDVPKSTPTINCVGKVIRSYKPQSASMYDIAIRFIDIRRQEKELLIKMMLSQN